MGVASPSRHESCKQPKRNGCKKSRLCNQVVASHPKLLGSDSQPDIHNILTNDTPPSLVTPTDQNSGYKYIRVLYNHKNTSKIHKKCNHNHINTVYNPMLDIPGLLHATEPRTINHNPKIMTCN